MARFHRIGLSNMDADHRHELKQNDLEEFLTHFKDFWAKWGNAITIAVLVVVLAFTGYRLWSVRQDTARQTALTELATADSPKALMSLARDASDPAVSTLAYLRAADRIVHDLALPPEARQPAAASPDAAPPAAEPISAEDKARQLDEAAAVYQQVIKQAPHPVYAYNAKLGLATVLEFQGKWEDAAKTYDALATEAAATHPGIAGQARARRAMLDRVQVPVLFAPEPPPAPAPALVPAPGDDAAPGRGAASDTSVPEQGATATPGDAPAPADAPATDAP